MDPSSSKKCHKKKRKGISTKAKRGVAMKKKVKEIVPKGNCFHYGLDGHWRRNCKACMEPMKKRACDASSSSNMFVIEVNTFLIIINGYWIPIVVLTFALMCKD